MCEKLKAEKQKNVFGCIQGLKCDDLSYNRYSTETEALLK